MVIIKSHLTSNWFYYFKIFCIWVDPAHHFLLPPHCCGVRLPGVFFVYCVSFFLFFGFFLKFYFIFKLYIIVLVLPNIKMNPPQIYMCSPS